VLIKRTERQVRRGSLAAFASQSDRGLDRRAFLRRSGLVAGGLAALGALPLASVRKAEAGPPPAPGATVDIRTTKAAIRKRTISGIAVILKFNLP